jgi:hypothetical protein
MGAEKNKKCNEKISVLVCRIRQLAEEAGGNAPTELPVFSERTISLRATTRSARGQSGFCSKKVRISTKRYRKFNQKVTLPFQFEGSPRIRGAPGECPANPSLSANLPKKPSIFSV